MNSAFEAGDNPLDPWVPYWGQGFPVLRYYQNFSHLVVVAVYQVLGKSVELLTIFKFVNLLFLTFLPLSFYLGVRLLGLRKEIAVFTAILVPLIAVEAGQRHLLGIQLVNFSWYGGGLFPQLLGMFFFAPALGLIYQALIRGRFFGSALLFISLTWLCHLLLGYMLCLVGIVVMIVQVTQGRKVALARLVILYLAVFVSISYQLLPTLLESEVLNRSVWEDKQYWDSYGMHGVLEFLVNGSLFDGGRFPVITLLLAVGIISGITSLVFSNKNSRNMLIVLLGFMVALLLYFGRPTWGALLNIMPFSDNLPFHRFICLVHYFGVILGGVGLFSIYHFVSNCSFRGARMMGCCVVLAILFPHVYSSFTEAIAIQKVKRDSTQSYNLGAKPLEDQLEKFRSLNTKDPGRGYAGTSWDWGRDYTMSNVPVYSFWSKYDLSAISYMYHTMGKMSDLETEFLLSREDHRRLFNTKYIMSYDKAKLPGDMEISDVRPGINAAVAQTDGYFGLVDVLGFVDQDDLSGRKDYQFNRNFINGRWHSNNHFVRIGKKKIGSETEVSIDETFSEPKQVVSNDLGRVIFQGGQGNHYFAKVEVKREAYLLFRMTYHPGWNARVDNDVADIVRLAPGYQGIKLSPGLQNVTMEYKPAVSTLSLFWLWPLTILAGFVLTFLKAWPLKSAPLKRRGKEEILTANLTSTAPAVGFYKTFFKGKGDFERIDLLRVSIVLFAVFIVSRVWLFFAVFENGWTDLPVYFDIYQKYMELSRVGLSLFDTNTYQYPPLMLPFFLLPGWVASFFGAVSYQVYVVAFRVMMSLVDLGILICLPFLIRGVSPMITTREAIVRAAMYIPIPLLLPTLAYNRMDLLVTLFMVVSLALIVNNRGNIGYFFLGIAGVLKLAPVILVLPFLVACWKSNKGIERLHCLFFWLLGIAAGVVPFLLFVGKPAFFFLQYQGDRGVQLESVPASLGMLFHIFGADAHTFSEAMATSLAFDGAQLLATVWKIIGLSIIAACAALQLFSGVSQDFRDNKKVSYNIAVALMAILISFATIFSPQYLFWLMPLILAVQVRAVSLWLLAVLLYSILSLTTVIFPVIYLELVNLEFRAMFLLIIRNALMLGLTALLLYGALRELFSVSSPRKNQTS